MKVTKELLIGGLIIIILACIVYASIYVRLNQIENRINQQNVLINETKEKVLASVVHIKTFSNGSNNMRLSAIYIDNKGQPYMGGTGFVIRKDGYILTAKHVVENASSIYIILQNSTEIQANVEFMNITTGNVGTDLAIIKVNATLPPIEFGNVSDYDVGTKVLTIGYPLTNAVPVTQEGMISLKGTRDNIPSVAIQATLNFGNSGGPVFLEESGKVIGVINLRESLVYIRPLSVPNIPTNLSSDSKTLLVYLVQLQQTTYGNLVDAISRNSQSGIAVATIVDSSILKGLPPQN